MGTSQSIGQVLYGLQRCENTAEVRGMLTAFTPKVASCQDKFKSQEIYMAFLGLRNCVVRNPEVCGMLDALAPKIAACEQKLRSRDIEAVFNVLKNASHCVDARNSIIV